MEFEALNESLRRHPEIAAAYVFGSALTGKMTPMSDIDVALVVQDQTPYGRSLALTIYIETDVQKFFQRAGDVKVLNHIRDLPFLHEVLATDILVREKVFTFAQGETFREMLGFRSRLAHDYAEVDLRKVYEIMTGQLQDLDDFVNALVTFFHL